MKTLNYKIFNKNKLTEIYYLKANKHNTKPQVTLKHKIVPINYYKFRSHFNDLLD